MKYETIDSHKLAPHQNQIFTLATRLSGLSCPRCASTDFHRHGRHLGIQRFRCKECGRTFKETVNTPLHWIHDKKKMQDYLMTMYEHKSLRNAADEIGIAEVTSFNWRHKILSSLSSLASAPSSAPAGICEIRLPHSFKGQRNIPETKMPVTCSILVTDARGIPCLQLLRKKKKTIEIAQLINENLHPSAQIATEKSNLLTRAERTDSRQKIRNPACRRSILSQAKTQMADLTDWMARFNGVATKYLQQYWNWYRAELHLGSQDKFLQECFGQRKLQSYRNLTLT